MTVKVIVTKKGASLPQNSWKEGQEVSMHKNLADHFEKNGLVLSSDGKPKTEQTSESATEVKDTEKKGKKTKTE